MCYLHAYPATGSQQSLQITTTWSMQLRANTTGGSNQTNQANQTLCLLPCICEIHCILSQVLILHTFQGLDSAYFPRSWFCKLSQVLILDTFPGPHSGYFPRSSFCIISQVLILDTFPGPGERTPSLRFVVSLPTQAESTPPVCRHISWQLKFQFPFCKISKYGFCFHLQKSNVSDVFSYALWQNLLWVLEIIKGPTLVHSIWLFCQNLAGCTLIKWNKK